MTSRMYKRSSLYEKVEVDNNIELDFLQHNFSKFEVEQAKVFKIKGHLAGKPSLISYEVYGTTELGWLIMLVNNIKDPYEELYVGRKLVIPERRDYYDFYSEYRKV